MGINSNLPPGCSVSDIPGNGPEDLAFESFEAELDAKLFALNVALPDPPADPEEKETLHDWVFKKIKDAYAAGHMDALADVDLFEERAVKANELTASPFWVTLRDGRVGSVISGKVVVKLGADGPFAEVLVRSFRLSTKEEIAEMEGTARKPRSDKGIKRG